MPTPRTKLGDWGEEQAVGFLKEKGYEIVATNYRCKYGEVDIVAMDGEELVFAEVRTRRPGNFGTPEESVSKHKLRRLMATCQDYLQNSGQENKQWWVDLISVRLEKGRSKIPKVERIDHLKHVLQQ
ncbi:MAG: hypothetical protein BZY87_04015 [SAR202 cluster bacterium Io17-Chloro-G6]|nr:MAG: hypothetical protein BZY87_04015 [SAR202 cluster bacterium Io17-Chloro-G6]